MIHKRKFLLNETIEIKVLLFKYLINRMKRQGTEWEKVFTNYKLT